MGITRRIRTARHLECNIDLSKNSSLVKRVQNELCTLDVYIIRHPKCEINIQSMRKSFHVCGLCLQYTDPSGDHFEVLPHPCHQDVLQNIVIICCNLLSLGHVVPSARHAVSKRRRRSRGRAASLRNNNLELMTTKSCLFQATRHSARLAALTDLLGSLLLRPAACC